jgi:hypothetical protein
MPARRNCTPSGQCGDPEAARSPCKGRLGDGGGAMAITIGLDHGHEAAARCQTC